MDQNKKGCVLRIERGSIHDGKGLRTVVFLKGCPLRCAWCSTPESQHFGPEKSAAAGRCTGCGRCIGVCPTGALSLEDGRIVTGLDRCTACFRCVPACPHGVHIRYGEEMDARSLSESIARDEVFFFHSGGGVTFSGGEPLAQADYMVEALKACRHRGINTGVETSLHVDFAEVEKILPWMDAFLVDLKHMDTAEHIRLTGCGNELVLENLLRLDAALTGRQLTIRLPVIPGLNDTAVNLAETADFCSRLAHIAEIELLPYHRLGCETYRHLGRRYTLEALQPPSPRRMEEIAREMASHARFPVRYGGGFLRPVEAV